MSGQAPGPAGTPPIQVFAVEVVADYRRAVGAQAPAVEAAMAVKGQHLTWHYCAERYGRARLNGRTARYQEQRISASGA